MVELIRPFASSSPDTAALTDEWGTTTWQALDTRAGRLIGALRGRGLTTGDVIAIHSGNRREYFELMTAAAHAGLRYVLVNWHWTAGELAYVLADSGAKALFIEVPFADVAGSARVPARISIGGDIPGCTPYEEFLATGPDGEPADQTLGVPMIYTSGTTGRPKAVTHKILTPGVDVATMKFVADLFTSELLIPEGGRTLLVGPVYHSAQWLWSFAPLCAGRPVVMRQAFDGSESLGLIDRYRITNVHLVPTQFVRLLRLDPATRAAFDGSSLTAVWHGAAPCPPEVKRRMIEWFGPVVHEYYGSTESSVNTIVTAKEWLEHPGTVGRPLPTTEIRVLRDDGTPAVAGERGRLWFRSTTGDEMEYWRDPGKTASIHRQDGFFTTGDIGYFDDDGYLYVADRAIDMIISGGVNIYPAEIEAILVTHPAVADAAVFGVPDEEFGEQVKAVVQLDEGFEPTDALVAELGAFCRASLAGYKVPRSIDFVAELPRTPTGKLYKRLLRDPYWSGQTTPI